MYTHHCCYCQSCQCRCYHCLRSPAQHCMSLHMGNLCNVPSKCITHTQSKQKCPGLPRLLSPALLTPWLKLPELFTPKLYVPLLPTPLLYTPACCYRLGPANAFKSRGDCSRTSVIVTRVVQPKVKVSLQQSRKRVRICS